MILEKTDIKFIMILIIGLLSMEENILEKRYDNVTPL